MVLPIFKKTIFDEMENKKITHQTIADSISSDDKQDVIRIMKQLIAHRDARGNWNIPKKQGLEIFEHFKKYVDKNAKPTLFGCGGCAKKMVNYMHQIFKIWQNQTK